MNWAEIITDLENKLSSKRFRHTINVVAAAEQLASHFGVDLNQARLAALLHDCAKNMSDEKLLGYAKEHRIKVDRVSRYDPQLLHGPVGAVLVKERYGITDAAIQRAVCYHTTGCKKMSALEKIIYLADYIEKDRSFPGIDAIREAAEIDLDRALILALTNSICHVAQTGALLHKHTLEARNDLLIKTRNVR
ncbi:bis(5'-nucleosyl)-tetraphosphatase (symmetrical) YqeK [Acetobacterium wieringae]|uniref:bis(5'-nucleosyl)-tetraphosphatase (symmetrical) YqeK n=1 Tax=Acetobacterium wieringae TaxID=52694 RepID=UPI0026EEE6BF|nr:bis(5'-nucleosyl)-tetraphosphatase (symmetrical) YqeK [Acetobacterium wieringae]